MAPDQHPRVFVYGNLMPGWPSWSRLRPFARTIRVDAVPGRIYDTGAGRPGAVFDEVGPVSDERVGAAPDDGGEVVEGWVVELHAHMVRPAFAELSRAQAEEYREVVVRTTEGADAVAWAWTGGTEALEQLPGRWRDPERRTG